MPVHKKFVSKKDSGDAGNKVPDRKKLKNKKRSGGAAGDDDDSVDSRGNLRGLIAYSEEEEVLSSDTESVKSGGRRKSVRKAALKARKRIQKKLSNTMSSDSSSSEKRGSVKVQKSSSASSSRGGLLSLTGGASKKRAGVIESDSEEEEEDDDEVLDSSEEDDSSAFDSSEEEEDEEEDEEYDDDDEEDADQRGGLIISFGASEEVDDRMIPKRHNMKKESADVKKFVKLVTQPEDEGGIDDQIDEFKLLTPEKQSELLVALERKPAGPTQQSMMFRILTMKLPVDIQSMVLSKYKSIQTMEPGTGEYYKQRAWLEKLISLPFGVYKDIPVKLSDGSEACSTFMERARKCLAEAIYGQEEAKIQILQFIASKIANPAARGLSLLLAGPPGIGKTSLIKNGIAKALGWPFQFISLGGDSDASTYVGHQVVYEGSHCGKIVNSLVSAKSMSMILMFDELDKISTTAKGEEVQNLLVHLTDPVQNGDFEDKYLSGIPIDLSKVLFTFSANDLGRIDRVLMDRMVVINLKGYTEKEKLVIAETFLLPAALREVNLEEKVSIGKDVLEHILKEYASEEDGVRELKRCIEAVAQKVNMLRIFNTKDLPFHIPDFQLPFVVKKSHIDLLLKKKKVEMDVSVQRMYT